MEQSGIRCFIGSLSGLDIEPGSCDVVTSLCVLPHHLAEPTPDMLAVARMLRPGGWFVLQFPDNGLFRRLGKLMYRTIGDSRLTRHVIANLYGPGGHQFAWTRSNLREYLSLCGFRNVSFQSYSGTPGITLARFRFAPAWYRACAAAAVYGLKISGDVLGFPNHSVAFARKQ
jgi:SAM-dependent methyltransferase